MESSEWIALLGFVATLVGTLGAAWLGKWREAKERERDRLKRRTERLEDAQRARAEQDRELLQAVLAICNRLYLFAMNQRREREFFEQRFSAPSGETRFEVTSPVHNECLAGATLPVGGLTGETSFDMGRSPSS